MKGVIMHWTGGTHNVSRLDKKHYHSIFAGDGTRVPGNRTREDNENTSDGVYAAHTYRMNTNYVGVSIACMGGKKGTVKWAAKLKDVVFGRYPPTPEQVTAMCKWVANLCFIYDIPVSGVTVLTHGEVEKNLKVKQKGKWDINFLPWLNRGGNTYVGDYLRKRIRGYLYDLENPASEVVKPFAPPIPDLPLPPTPILQPPSVVEKALRANGSRTINAADVQTKVTVWGGVTATVLGVVSEVSDALSGVPPYVWAALAVVACVGLFLYAREIKAARVNDAMTGKNTARLE